MSAPGATADRLQTAELETTETEWGVAYERGGIYDVTLCESELAARQLQAASGGKWPAERSKPTTPMRGPRSNSRRPCRRARASRNGGKRWARCRQGRDRQHARRCW